MVAAGLDGNEAAHPLAEARGDSRPVEVPQEDLVDLRHGAEGLRIELDGAAGGDDARTRPRGAGGPGGGGGGARRRGGGPAGGGDDGGRGGGGRGIAWRVWRTASLVTAQLLTMIVPSAACAFRTSLSAKFSRQPSVIASTLMP